MAILAELGGTITVTAGDGYADLLGDVDVTDDLFAITLSVDARAAVALARRFTRLGFRVTINEQAVPSRDLAAELSISESRDTFGDTLSLKLGDPSGKLSPFSRALIRTRANVAVFAKIGAPGAEHAAKIFDGYIVEPSYDMQPAAASLQCLDAAALYAQRRARNYAVPPNSGKTRLQVGLELCAIGSIPTGAIDLPNGHGGIINKPLAPGDQPIVDYLRDFWGVLGVWVWFEDGRLVARRYRADEPIVMELHAGNMLAAGVSAIAPPTLNPNVLGAVAVSFERREIGGRRQTETRVITVGPYAPASASGPWPEQRRTISEVITRTTYMGTLDEYLDETESGWYALRAASKQIAPSEDPPGYSVDDYAGTFFIYPDGSARATQAEKFQQVRRRTVKKETDGRRNVVRIHERRYFYHFLQRAVWQVEDDVDVLQTTSAPIPLSDQGQGLAFPREVSGMESTGAAQYAGSPDAETITEYELNLDDTIRAETVTEHFHTIGEQRLRADGAYGYGMDSVTYGAFATEASTDIGRPWRGTRITTKRYRVINEDTYEVAETVREGIAAPTTTTRRMTGGLPRPERAEPESTAQEIRREIVDRERLAFAGGEEIDRIENNEFIETTADADLYVQHLAREAAALRLRCAIPFETLLHKGRAVRINLPGASIHRMKFYVDQVQRDGSSGREEIVAVWYPPELG